MVSVGTRNRFLIGIISYWLLSCGPSADQRGEIIPPQSVYNQSQRPGLVISYVTQLLRENDGAHLYYLRAKAYFQLRDYIHAHADILKALEKTPSDVDYLLLSAQIKSQMGWYSLALEDAKALESTGYSSFYMYLTLGEIYLASHSKRLASSYLRQANALGVPVSEKKYINYLSMMARGDSLLAMHSIQLADINHGSLGNAYFRYQLPRMSHLAYQKLILSELKKYPFDPYLLLNWGRFLVQLHQYGRAEKVYQQTLRQLPHNPALLLEIGEYYVRIANYTQALNYLNQVPKQSGVYREALYNQVLVYLNLGQKSRSLSMLDSARMQFVTDARFSLLRDRLIGKRIDSTVVKLDSTTQKSD
jgi:tetratricopeptide (TPR) repeat protein